MALHDQQTCRPAVTTWFEQLHAGQIKSSIRPCTPGPALGVVAGVFIGLNVDGGAIDDPTAAIPAFGSNEPFKANAAGLGRYLLEAMGGLVIFRSIFRHGRTILFGIPAAS